MRWWIAILLVSACGKAPVTTIDPELQSYVDEFAAVGNLTSLPALYIHFGSLENEAGECDMKPGTVNEVIINAQSWAQQDEAERTVLMFHELGHCVLGRVHNTTTVDGVAVSIMYPNSSAAATGFSEHPGTYLKELFGRAY